MNTPTISLRICLWTEMGPAGARLFKAQPWPQVSFSYPCTREGMEAAKEAVQKLQDYIDRSESRINKGSKGGKK